VTVPVGVETGRTDGRGRDIKVASPDDWLLLVQFAYIRAKVFVPFNLCWEGLHAASVSILQAKALHGDVP